MTSDCLLPYYTAKSGSRVGMFNTAMGKLQRQLYKGEYDIFKYAPIFESDFIQITKRGEVIDVHNRVRMVTVGIACTSPSLPLPDVMLLARPAAGCDEYGGQGQPTKGRRCKAAKALELTRLLPLKFVRISVHDREKQQLRLKFATGRSCYLQLCPPVHSRKDLFAYWERLIYLLRPPVDSNSSTYAVPAEDMCMPVLEEDTMSLGGADLQGKGDQDQVSIRSLHIVSEVCGATSAAYAGGEWVQHDSHKPLGVPDASTPKTKPTDFAKESATGATTEVAVAGAAAGTVGALSLAATRSGDVSTIAGGAVLGGSKSNIAIAGTASKSPKSIKVAAAGAASKSSEHISSTSTNVSPEGTMSVAIAGIEPTSKTAGERDNSPAEEPPISTLLSESSLSEPHGRWHAHASAEARKEQRERRGKRERRDKDRALSGRSTHDCRTGESGRKTSRDKIARKSSSRSSSSHGASREDRKDKRRRSPGASSTGSSHKGVNHTLITKDSRTYHKSGRSMSTTSSGSSKRLSRIGSFWKNVKANLTTKAVSSPRGRDVDIMAKTLEKNTMQAIVKSGQDLEMVGSVTSEIKETVTFTAH